MPTPGGKPRKGDRIEWHIDNSYGRAPFKTGTVVARTNGAYYALHVHWDHEPHGQTRLLVDAPYWLQQGNLRLITTEGTQA